MTCPQDPRREPPEGDDPCRRPEASEHFAALLSRHHPALLSYILSLVPNWTDAEDLLQQTSVVMWRKFAEFQPGTDFFSWGCQIARFHTLNYLRKQTRDRHVFSVELVETLADEGMVEADELDAERLVLRSCFERLAPKNRILLNHCYRADATVKQVAEILGRTPNSVYKGLNRIREALLRCVRRALVREGP